MTLALHGGTPVRQHPLPQRPSYGHDELKAAEGVVVSGNLSGFLAASGDAYLGGPCVRRLEGAVCRDLGVRHAVSMNSATSCLYGAVQALRVAPRDEVIVSPWSMSASAACVLEAGAVPVFADIEPETYGLDATAVARAVTPRTRAIIAVDLFGCPPRDMKEICSYGIPVIEDAAQAIGAQCADVQAGMLGDIGVFSLNRHKTIQCGEGGIAVTDDDNDADFLRGYRNHGEVVNYRRGCWGGNYRMGEIEAAIAKVQLGRLEELTAPRVLNAQRLTAALSEMPGLVPPYVPRGYRHVFYLYAIQIDGSAERFARALTAEGIPASRYVEPLYRLPVFRGYGRCDESGTWEAWYPGVERAYRHVVVIPHVHAGMAEEDIDDIIQAVQKVHDHLDQI